MHLELILSIHNHQPVGNFENVIEEASQKAYLRFIEIARKYPRIKFVLHYSGYLLDFFKKKHPELIKEIKQLVKEKRVEILTGGYYEPVLSVIPERDAVIQIKNLSGEIEKTFGYEPRGIWLAERVWEPQLPGLLSRAGVRYLSVDDHHFKLAGIDEQDLTGYFITEYSGKRIYIFPGSERLRYFIPFKPVDEVMGYLFEFMEVVKKRRNNSFTPVIILSDDGEKFGVWPGTYKHCYEDGWLDSFLRVLSEIDWLKTTTFSEYIENNRPAGRVYLGVASYREMGEWALPVKRSLRVVELYKELSERYGDEAKHLLSGGIWRNFFVKYPESNHLHKRMLHLSDYVHKGMKFEKRNKGLLKSHLMSQCNDGYWHGIFGGLYLPHLRGAIYKNILKTQSLLEKQGLFPSFIDGDMDYDGVRDILLSNNDFSLFITEKGGSIIEFGIKKRGINLFDVLTRREEAYHHAILRKDLYEDRDSQDTTTKTIHERLDIKEKGLEDYLFYDLYRRASLLDRFIPHGTDLHNLDREFKDSGDFFNSIYTMKRVEDGVELMRSAKLNENVVTLTKHIILAEYGIDIRYSLNGEIEDFIATEFNISLGGSPDAILIIGERRYSVTEKKVLDNIERIRLTLNDIYVEFETSPPARVIFYPVYTVSLSESGVEKIYQGTSILFMRDGGILNFFYKVRVY